MIIQCTAADCRRALGCRCTAGAGRYNSRPISSQARRLRAPSRIPRMASLPLFWLLAFVLLAGTLAFLVVPLVRRRTAEAPPGDESAATAVFRDHKRQIEDDFAAGAVTAAERDTALAELLTRFGDELAHTPTATVGHQQPRWIVAMLLVACVPIAAAVLYFNLGNPAAMTAASATADPVNDPQVAAMVDALAKKLQANPEDGSGWALLERSYRALGRFEPAALAYGEAARRLPPSAPLLTDWAESVAQAQGRSLAGQPSELLDRALKLDPDYPKALALGGAAAMERNDLAAAAALWRRLKPHLPAGGPEAAQVDSVLAKIEAASSAPAAAATGASVAGRVELDPQLAARAAPSDTLFIFARDPDRSRMPLAAMKITVAELPKAFTLTDAMAMSPAATISQAKTIVVEARVSKSGNAAPQSGDLAGSSKPVAAGARDVRIVIDRVVP